MYEYVQSTSQFEEREREREREREILKIEKIAQLSPKTKPPYFSPPPLLISSMLLCVLLRNNGRSRLLIKAATETVAAFCPCLVDVKHYKLSSW